MVLPRYARLFWLQLRMSATLAQQNDDRYLVAYAQRALGEAYLAAGDSASRLVDDLEAQEKDWHDVERARFVVAMAGRHQAVPVIGAQQRPHGHGADVVALGLHFLGGQPREGQVHLGQAAVQGDERLGVRARDERPSGQRERERVDSRDVECGDPGRAAITMIAPAGAPADCSGA